MNLLFSRSQKRVPFFSFIPLRFGGTVTFRLKAELELSEEELVLARKYSLNKATLTRSKIEEDLSNAFRPAWFLASLATIAAVVFIPASRLGRGMEGIIYKAATVPAIGLICFVVLSVMYFFALRKHVTASQLMNGGRMFYCYSVVELEEHEKELLDISKRFYRTIEKAKNWGGREINPLPDGKPFYLNDPEGLHYGGGVNHTMHKAGQAAAKLAEPFRASTQNHDPSEPPKSLFQKLGDAIHDPKPSAQPRPQQSAQEATRPQTTPTNPVPNPAPARPQSTPPSQPTQQPSAQEAPHPFAPKPSDDGTKGF